MIDVVRAFVQGGYVVPTRQTFPALALRNVPNELRRRYRLASGIGSSSWTTATSSSNRLRKSPHLEK
jgi:hypothetical protein